MDIQYICKGCRKKFNTITRAKINAKGFPGVNEIGRKYCDTCGTNEDSLYVISKQDLKQAISQRVKK